MVVFCRIIDVHALLRVKIPFSANFRHQGGPPTSAFAAYLYLAMFFFSPTMAFIYLLERRRGDGVRVGFILAARKLS